MTASPPTDDGLQPTASLLREAGLQSEFFYECIQGPERPGDYYDGLADQPQEPSVDEQ